MKNVHLKRMVSFLIILVFISSNTNAEQLSSADISFEVKFLLSPEKVLTSGSMLSESIMEEFGLAGDYTVYDVVYLETADQSFINEGWVNRIRWKRGKKKPERTCKKRYAVSGDDQASILSCLEKVVSDGIDVQSENCSLEIDWGYSKMTLSATWETSGKYKDYQSLQEFTTADLISYFAETMPSEERNWKSPGWADEELAHAQKAGIVTLNRIKGVWEDTEVTFDILRLPLDDAVEDIVELSFKSDDYASAASKRQQLTQILDGEGILLHADSLKTQRILDAFLYDSPADPDCLLPLSTTRIGEGAFQGSLFKYVWCGDQIAYIENETFADCPNLKYIRLPEKETEIAEGAFPADRKLCIVGVAGSYADVYASEHNYGFVQE